MKGRTCKTSTGVYSSQQGAIGVCTCTVTNHYHKQMYIRYIATGVQLLLPRTGLQGGVNLCKLEGEESGLIQTDCCM